jgi:hypothetical protein
MRPPPPLQDRATSGDELRRFVIPAADNGTNTQLLQNQHEEIINIDGRGERAVLSDMRRGRVDPAEIYLCDAP